MHQKLKRALDERWVEYERLRAGGDICSALIRLSEIENCLEHQPIRAAMRQEWGSVLRGVSLSSEDVQRALTGAAARVERLRRMLGIGTRFVYEEVMLAITERVELDLLLEFCRKRGIGDFERITVASLDLALVELAQAKQHAAMFSSAQAVARRNWGIPLQTRWLMSGVEVSRPHCP